MLSDILRSTGAGAVFGVALTMSRVYHPSVIISQMRLTDFHMLEVFLTACATSAIVMLYFEKCGISKRCVRSNSTLNWFSPYDANIIGGALLGIGMSLTGACPGTAIVQLAQGFRSSGPTTLGLLLGASFFLKFGKLLKCKEDPEHKPQQPGAQTIASKTHVEPAVIFLTFDAFCFSAIILSSLTLPGRSFATIPTVLGGVLLAAAQGFSIYFTGNPVGVSAAYEHLGRYLLHGVGFKDVPEPGTFPKAITFALGMFAGSLVYTELLQPEATVGAPAIPVAQALIGGFSMGFGARLAGGCTSGHGLSGLSALSFSSLITVLAMFGAGIITQLFLP
ncbi:uncharacterized protein Z519_08798 [Cladophialophora bantiana CBS 173.52]|uniref:Sulphur transport domain-containing protein n=1 Tax=Cladophialophora bantiana (strain ATCC 10958 / CBS 173.52 / CDC B-1940 / NIH 8579) TaxID=1442370 RepID=A0A0D2HH93_CLAB1|nr:uncharacterized protein Z519_08798 [Cladophialophora bantiana CBS 173.52]KIW90155.1 hypothetical protein Z519_08798 [Cladophialophora bantiana CBS 173.52]